MSLSKRPADQDPAVGAVAIQIFGKLGIDDNAAVVAGRGSVHEMQHTVACAQCEADMRGRINATSVARNYSDDVATVQLGFDFCDLAFWNLI